MCLCETMRRGEETNSVADRLDCSDQLSGISWLSRVCDDHIQLGVSVLIRGVSAKKMKIEKEKETEGGEEEERQRPKVDGKRAGWSSLEGERTAKRRH